MHSTVYMQLTLFSSILNFYSSTKKVETPVDTADYPNSTSTEFNDTSLDKLLSDDSNAALEVMNMKKTSQTVKITTTYSPQNNMQALYQSSIPVFAIGNEPVLHSLSIPNIPYVIPSFVTLKQIAILIPIQLNHPPPKTHKISTTFSKHETLTGNNQDNLTSHDSAQMQLSPNWLNIPLLANNRFFPNSSDQIETATNLPASNISILLPQSVVPQPEQTVFSPFTVVPQPSLNTAFPLLANQVPRFVLPGSGIFPTKSNVFNQFMAPLNTPSNEQSAASPQLTVQQLNSEQPPQATFYPAVGLIDEFVSTTVQSNTPYPTTNVENLSHKSLASKVHQTATAHAATGIDQIPPVLIENMVLSSSTSSTIPPDLLLPGQPFTITDINQNQNNNVQLPALGSVEAVMAKQILPQLVPQIAPSQPPLLQSSPVLNLSQPPQTVPQLPSSISSWQQLMAQIQQQLTHTPLIPELSVLPSVVPQHFPITTNQKSPI